MVGDKGYPESILVRLSQSRVPSFLILKTPLNILKYIFWLKIEKGTRVEQT